MIHAPVSPGEILRRDVIEPRGLTISGAARWLGVSRSTLSLVLSARTDLTHAVAVKLEAAGVGTAETWLHLQSAYSQHRMRFPEARKRHLSSGRE